MRIKDAKLGDRVILYIDPRGYLSETRQERTIVGTLYGICHDYNDHLIGWRDSEKRPVNVVARDAKFGLDPAVKYSDNQAEFTWRRTLPVYYEIVGIESNQSSSSKGIKQGLDMSDWRNWRHNRPGECACGIPRERCIYHK